MPRIGHAISREDKEEIASLVLLEVEPMPRIGSRTGDTSHSPMIKIRRNQIYQAKKRPDFQVEIMGKRDNKWMARVLTHKTGVYAGTHKLSKWTIEKEYSLIS